MIIQYNWFLSEEMKVQVAVDIKCPLVKMKDQMKETERDPDI